MIGGSRNDRIIRARTAIVREKINPLEERCRAMSDEELLAQTPLLKKRIAEGTPARSVLPEAFALVREASMRAINIRHFDVQLVAGMILYEGWIAEEATGEGKTFACYPAIYLAALEGMHVHVITTNDYLVKRDAELARQVFERLGVSVGYIASDMPAYGEGAKDRKNAYSCDVTYGTNSEFGFDYLRDNMKTSLAEQVQGPLDFAIIDEVDSILIDEARTPLIISGPAYGETDRFRKADAVARELISRNRPWDQSNRQVESLKRQIKSLQGESQRTKGDDAQKIRQKLQHAMEELEQAQAKLDGLVKHFEVELDKKAVHMTHEGVAAAQEIAGVGSFYVGANMEWPHLMEQALRAHLVFETDKDYVVQEGKVVIVDEFTGRLLEGREWSDGLHQAVDAKERVAIKEENQTMATITYQNFFKLYKRLAGMTGTAMTEAGEFLKIYKLDVASVQTHRPVNRVDHNDRIYADTEAKFAAIAEEVNHYSKLGRPVLVGTTSIEKSEKLSNILVKNFGIDHQVLNARPENATREADIVLKAGQRHQLRKDSDQMVGTVTIATNMAGRGVDIKLGEGVVWPNCKVPSTEKLAELGVEPEELFPPGSSKCCINCPQYDPATNCAHCFKPKLDPNFPKRGKSECTEVVPCGLHIVGTERHEARRIDNQLRGRSGRQGDPGSSRFFLSIRDDLMSIFAGEWTLKVLGWLGLQGDMAIEDRRVSKGVERAQRKVEERNFEIRKNLLEYDEVMDFQRRAFYGQRQRILQGQDLDELVSEIVESSITDGVDTYLDGKYAQKCIAEWARTNLQINISEDQVHAVTIEELEDLERDLRRRAKDEVSGTVAMTLGEYMDEEGDQRDWDLKGLSSWAMSRFNVNISQNQLRKMTAGEIEEMLVEEAWKNIDHADLTPLAKYLDPDFPRLALVEWTNAKFAIEIDSAELGNSSTKAREVLWRKARELYCTREVEYPVEYALDMTVGRAGMDNVYALGALVEWANKKYLAGWSVDDVKEMKISDLQRRLTDMSREYLVGDKLRQEVDAVAGDRQQAIEFARRRFDTELSADVEDMHAELMRVGRAFLRREMTELERFVLLQIHDSSWVDHLLAMDHLKSGIGLRGFAERDPKVAFKIEGSKLFEEMMTGIREKVADMIFKVRLSPGEQVSSAYRVTRQVHEQLSGYDHLTQGMDQTAQAGETQKVQTIVRDVPKVGRNDPCPCGSGKKYKKCCGKNSD